MDITTRNFLRLLRVGAFGEQEQIEPMSAWKWHRVFQLAVMHEVSALLYDGILACQKQFFLQLPEPLLQQWEKSVADIQDVSQRTNEATISLLEIFNRMQLRPILLNGMCLSTLYEQPLHRQADAIEVFFPFDTQGHKADQWAAEHGNRLRQEDRFTLRYRWQETEIVHHHRAGSLTNTLLSHTLHSICENDIRESEPTHTTCGNMKAETPSPTLSVLLLLLGISRCLLTEGLSLKQVTDLGIFLRKAGDKVDFVKLQSWIDRLRLGNMAQLCGTLLVEFFHFTPNEIPFMSEKGSTSLKHIMREMTQLRHTKGDEWYFQQGNDIFVHTANSQALLWQAKHSARYFTYYPTESITNFFASFAHSLSHIEE